MTRNTIKRVTRELFPVVQEHALIGSILVILIIFAFLRDFRSTLIVSTRRATRPGRESPRAR